MLLDLTSILHMPGEAVPFSFSMDLSGLDLGGNRPARELVDIRGQVKNEAGVLLLSANMKTTLHCVCDRCATPFLREFSRKVDAVLTEELYHEENEDGWTFPLQDGQADLSEIFNTAFVLNMDSKTLCGPDCKGLCPTCGKDLNDGPCGCRKEPDPRLAVLGRLLKDKE